MWQTKIILCSFFICSLQEQIMGQLEAKWFGPPFEELKTKWSASPFEELNKVILEKGLKSVYILPFVSYSKNENGKEIIDSDTYWKCAGFIRDDNNLKLFSSYLGKNCNYIYGEFPNIESAKFRLILIVKGDNPQIFLHCFIDASGWFLVAEIPTENGICRIYKKCDTEFSEFLTRVVFGSKKKISDRYKLKK